MGETALNRSLVSYIEFRGFASGTDLENRAAKILSYGYRPPHVAQQYRVAGHRIDFAWPDIQVALEVDGWWHRSPEGASKDAVRDRRLRAAGWVVLRADDHNGMESFEDQVVRVAQLVWCLRQHPR